MTFAFKFRPLLQWPTVHTHTLNGSFIHFGMFSSLKTEKFALVQFLHQIIFFVDVPLRFSFH